MLRRWIKAHVHPKVYALDGTSEETVEMLHRCLDSLRKIENVNEKGVFSEAYDLLCLVDDAAKDAGDDNLEPGNKAFSMCLNVMAKYPQDMAALDCLLDLLDRRRALTAPCDLQFYNACLHAFAKCSPFHPDAPERAEALLQEMSREVTPDGASFVSIMQAWASSKVPGTAERSQAILDQLIKTQQDCLTISCFNVCIHGWANENAPECAEELLWLSHRLYKQGLRELRPTTVSFNSTINAWAKSQHRNAGARAEKVLAEMDRYGCMPTQESYTAVLDAWGKSDQPGQKVEALLNRLEEMHATSPQRFPAPSKVTYLVAIRAWSRTTKDSNAPRKAEALVQRMRQLSDHGRTDLPPCGSVLSALIEVWSRSRRPDSPEQALALFRKMLAPDSSMTPTTFALNCVLDAFAHCGRAGEAEALLQEMEIPTSGDQVIRPDNVSYTIVLKAFSKSSDLDAADRASALLSTLEKHPDPILRPSITAYNHVMASWGNSSRNDAAEIAEQILQDLISGHNAGVGVQPNLVSVNCVLRAWARSQEGGSAERADAIFRWMEETGYSLGITPDERSFYHAMQAWTHSGRRAGPTRVEEYLNRLKGLCEDGSEIHLTTALYNLAILAWSRSRDPKALQEIVRLVEEMYKLAEEGHDLLPDATTLHYVSRAISNERTPRKRKHAERAVQRMLGEGIRTR